MSDRIGNLTREEDLEAEQNIQLECLKYQLYLQSLTPPSTMRYLHI